MDEQSIFLGALEKTSPEEVATWLDANCGLDQQLRVAGPHPAAEYGDTV